jgi:hypothetical protein
VSGVVKRRSEAILAQEKLVIVQHESGASFPLNAEAYRSRAV